MKLLNAVLTYTQEHPSNQREKMLSIVFDGDNKAEWDQQKKMFFEVLQAYGVSPYLFQYNGNKAEIDRRSIHSIPQLSQMISNLHEMIQSNSDSPLQKLKNMVLEKSKELHQKPGPEK